MSQRPSKIPLPSPASALLLAGNSHPFVAMSGLLDSDPTLHRNILDASTPQSIRDATTAGPIDDAILCNSTCDANAPAGVREVAKPLGPHESSPTTTIRALSTPRTKPRPSNAAFVTPAPQALVGTDDIANYAHSSFQHRHTWSKDVRTVPGHPPNGTLAYLDRSWEATLRSTLSMLRMKWRYLPHCPCNTADSLRKSPSSIWKGLASKVWRK